MPAIISSPAVEDCLRQLLSEEGYSLSPVRTRGETGVDILASKDEETWHIEVIAYKSAGATRARDFCEAFFRAISRIDENAEHCVIALPSRWEQGLAMRAQRKNYWTRIGDAFPELEIWLVDVGGRSYTRRSWNVWTPAPRGVVSGTLPDETLAELKKQEKDE